MKPDLVKRIREEARPHGTGNYRDELWHEAADEIVRLREVISGVIVVYNSGALKDYDGEPWLNRVLTTDL